MRLDVREVARLFDVAEKTVYRWVEEDGLPAHEIENLYRFHRAEVLEWATSRDLSPSPEIFEAADDAPLDSISQALQRGGLFYDVPSTSPSEALAAIVERLPIVNPIERALVHDVLAARKGFGETNSGLGIAIPHVRHPIVLDVPAPTVTVCLLATPVDLGDGPPIHTFFALITPSVRSHLIMVSRLAFVVHDEAVRGSLSRRAPSTELLSAISHTEASLRGPASQE